MIRESGRKYYAKRNRSVIIPPVLFTFRTLELTAITEFTYPASAIIFFGSFSERRRRLNCSRQISQLPRAALARARPPLARRILSGRIMCLGCTRETLAYRCNRLRDSSKYRLFFVVLDTIPVSVRLISSRRTDLD